MIRRKILPLAYGLTFYYLFNIIIPIIFRLEFNNGFVLTFAYFLSGVVVGYFAKEKAWMLGLLIGFLPYLILLLGIFIFVFYLLIQTNFNVAPTQGWPINGEIIRTHADILVKEIFLSMLGAIVGERLYKIKVIRK